MTNLDHGKIDARLLRLVAAVVSRIDREPALFSVLTENVRHWPDERLRREWEEILRLPWPELRAMLLAESDEGAALRQNAPLGGMLAPVIRSRIMREFSHDSRAT